MEYILMALFGGGILDWQDISKTQYEWEDIFEQAKTNYGANDLEINDLYATILEMALYDLEQAMRNCEKETSEEFKECYKNIENYFEIYTNYLDTRLYYVGDNEELAQEIQEKLEDEIDEINEKIGFTYIQF